VFRHASSTWAHSADYNRRKHDVRVNFMLSFDYYRTEKTVYTFQDEMLDEQVGITPKIKLVERGLIERAGDRVKPVVDCRLEMTMEDT
jgi:hypothetical protein